MAISSPVNTNETTGSTQQQPTSGNTNNGGERWTFHKRDTFGRAPIGRGIGSEALTKLQTALTEEYKKADSSFEITIIPIDNSNESAYFSSLIVCLRDKTALKDGVAFHTLIIEATGEPIIARTEQINNNNVEVLRVPGDAYDQVMMKMILERVNAAFPGLPAHNTMATVVSRAFNFEDKISIHNLALNTGLATSTELITRQKDFNDINLANHVSDSNLTVSLTFSNQQIENSVGEPTRADVGIGFSSQQTRYQANQSMNSDERATRVSSLSGFVDLFWSPVAPQQGLYGAYAQQAPMFNQQQFVPSQQYGARFVITSLESNYASTIPAQLLSLVTSLGLSTDGNWMQAFRPTPRAGKRIQMHDIGALGIEVRNEGNAGGFGKKIDTSGDDFRAEQLGQLISALIRPGLTLSMDVPECGPETWYTSIFSAAANGSMEAAEALENAANQLTNGAFWRHFQHGTPMFTDLGNRVHLGYYTDETGVKRDLRDVDYLAVANMVGERDPAAIRDWSDTFLQTRFPLLQRLAARKRIISGLLPDAVFTGFAHRVTFTTKFTTSLSMACAEAGLSIMPVITPMNTGDLNNTRGVGNFVTDAMIPMNSGNVFNHMPSMGGPAGFGSYNSFNPRWSR